MSATVPDDLAGAIRRAVNDLPTTAMTDPAVSRHMLPVDKALGLATLAYCDAARFQPADSSTVGVGKTHLATALGHIAVRRRIGVHMTRAEKLFKRLKAARLDNTVEAETRRLAHTQLLIIDDFCLQALDAAETADFYEIIVKRHQKSATIVTSNREPNEWLAMMADPLLAQSAVDRLTSTCHELIIEGDSYRRRQRPTITNP